MKKLALLAAAVLLVSATAARADDVADGKKLFSQCAVCHTADNTGKNKIGPNLFGIVGRKIATEAGYKYSDGMKSHTGVWDEATLSAYLENPKKWEPKTKMTFAGFKDEAKRKQVIAYLKTLK